MTRKLCVWEGEVVCDNLVSPQKVFCNVILPELKGDGVEMFSLKWELAVVMPPNKVNVKCICPDCKKEFSISVFEKAYHSLRSDNPIYLKGLVLKLCELYGLVLRMSGRQVYARGLAYELGRRVESHFLKGLKGGIDGS